MKSFIFINGSYKIDKFIEINNKLHVLANGNIYRLKETKTSKTHLIKDSSNFIQPKLLLTPVAPSYFDFK